MTRFQQALVSLGSAILICALSVVLYTLMSMFVNTLLTRSQLWIVGIAVSCPILGALSYFVLKAFLLVGGESNG